jgi:hypothetical protein
MMLAWTGGCGLPERAVGPAQTYLHHHWSVGPLASHGHAISIARTKAGLGRAACEPRAHAAGIDGNQALMRVVRVAWMQSGDGYQVLAGLVSIGQ